MWKMYVRENFRLRLRLLNPSDLQKLDTIENTRVLNNNFVEALTFEAFFCSYERSSAVVSEKVMTFRESQPKIKAEFLSKVLTMNLKIWGWKCLLFSEPNIFLIVWFPAIIFCTPIFIVYCKTFYFRKVELKKILKKTATTACLELASRIQQFFVENWRKTR